MGVYMRPTEPAPRPEQPSTTKLSRPAPGTNAKPAMRPARAPEVAVAPKPSGVLPPAYRILLTKSIFCPHPKGPSTDVKSSDSKLVLLGIVQSKRAYFAYVQNSASGVARTIQVGDTLGPRKVTNIDVHSVEFVEGKRAMRIAIGQSFDSGNGSAVASVRSQID